MGAAILEQQEQQEKVDYKESFPTTDIYMTLNSARVTQHSAEIV